MTELRRAVYILAPLFLLLAAIGLAALLPSPAGGRLAGEKATSPTAGATTPMPSGLNAATSSLTAEVMSMALATPWEVMRTPTITSTSPVVSAEESVTRPVEPIVILGPPHGSRFRADDPITFLWRWRNSLEEGQRFVVYLSDGEQSTLLGSIDEPNFGEDYRLEGRLPDSVGGAGDYSWVVVLESERGESTILSSETRSLSVLQG